MLIILHETNPETFWLTHVLRSFVVMCAVQYKATDFVAPGPGKYEIVYTPKNKNLPVSYFLLYG